MNLIDLNVDRNNSSHFISYIKYFNQIRESCQWLLSRANQPTIINMKGKPKKNVFFFYINTNELVWDWKQWNWLCGSVSGRVHDANKGIDWLPLRCSFKGKRTNCLLVCIRNRDGLKVKYICHRRRPRHNYFITKPEMCQIRSSHPHLPPFRLPLENHFQFSMHKHVWRICISIRIALQYLLGCVNIHKQIPNSQQ